VNLPRRNRDARVRPQSLGQSYAAYLSLRLLLFLGALVLCMVLGLRGLVAVVAALLLSGVLSYPLARRQRNEIVQQFQNRRGRR
jgi:NhaP-type Na+/H+ or K+/H+ antiporter